jgi:hypothetical protein
LAPTSLRFKNNTPPTVRQLFGMGTNRGYYDTNIEAGSKSFTPSLFSPPLTHR